MNRSADEILKHVYGYSSFRGDQAAIIEHVVSGNDCLVVMPTGGGKSICYQIPAMMRPGVGVVISPLISLMRDQVQALKRLGINAECLNSSLASGEARAIKRAVYAGELQLLYVAPERLLMESSLEMLGAVNVALFAIDEAHCASQWGHDFRPEYAQLGVLKERFPGIPRIALTATADPPTRRDLARLLHFSESREFLGGFDRPNIQYRVTYKQSAHKQLLKFIRDEHKGDSGGDSGIVYCNTRKAVDETAKFLVDHGIEALPYHAGLSDQERARNQDLFLSKEELVVVGTVAFGMGIDKPNVRFVAHTSLPRSVEAYYQETGRAGRDGLPATAWMTYGMGDIALQRQMIQSGDAPPERKQIELRKLNSLLGFVETAGCRRKVLLNYFGDVLSAPCNNCDTCLEPVESWDGTVAAQQVLSCIYRTGQRFGAGHIVDVLRGNKTDKVERFRHEQLPTFGIGTNLAEREWQSVLRQLIAGGYLGVQIDSYGVLSLTESSRSILRNEESVTFRKDPAPQSGRGKKRSGRGARSAVVASEVGQSGLGKAGGVQSGSAAGLQGTDHQLFLLLREKRLKLAQSEHVPPYVIFHDRSLLEMASQRPTSLSALSEIYGVGENKLHRYGQQFIDTIAGF